MIERVVEDGLDIVSSLFVLTAITAPKSVGRDDIMVEVVREEKIKNRILDRAVELTRETRFSFYERDAENCRNISHIILVGYKMYYHNFDCGFCGFKSCDDAKAHGAVCAVSITDAGIAVGSLVKLSSILGIDNRIMISIGRAAKEIGYFKEPVGGAYGIPLSVSTKNPFFDRKKKS